MPKAFSCPFDLLLLGQTVDFHVHTVHAASFLQLCNVSWVIACAECRCKQNKNKVTKTKTKRNSVFFRCEFVCWKPKVCDTTPRTITDISRIHIICENNLKMANVKNGIKESFKLTRKGENEFVCVCCDVDRERQR